MVYWIISGKHSYILKNVGYERCALAKPESEYFDSREENVMDLHFTEMQRMDIKKALKRGIYKELHDRNYLSDAQLDELISKNM